MRASIAHLVLSICVLFGSPARRPAAAEDRIDLRDGKSIAGRIQQETATEIVIQSASGMQKIPVNDVNQIHYEGQPAILTHAKTLEDSSRFNQAADEYAKAQAEVEDKPFILQAAKFGEARARAHLALDSTVQLDEAIARLEKLEQAYSGSRHHFSSQELLGRLYIEKQDYSKAFRALDELSNAPWRDMKLRSVIYHSRLLRAQNKVDEAIQRLDSALQSKPELTDQELPYCELLLEKARGFRALGRRTDEAIILEQVIDRLPAGATAQQAEAYVALGDCRRADGKPWDAVWSFLHVQLLFAKHEQPHARALYNLAQLWAELGHPERAAATQSMLKTEHPKSPWTKKLN